MENQNLQPRSGAVYGKEEEEEEEVKMETFFALVRNFKEMRDQRRKELMIGGETEAAEKNRKRMKTTTTTTWIPRFEREDFDENFQVRGPGLVLPMKPCNLVKEETAAIKKKNKKVVKGEDDCLDLNLAL